MSHGTQFARYAGTLAYAWLPGPHPCKQGTFGQAEAEAG